MASNTRIQGGHRARPRQSRAVLLSAALLLAATPAAARELCRFDAGGLAIDAADAGAEGGLGVEITVADGPLVLTRLAVPAEEGAAGCWQFDLDGDGRFEIIVGLVQDGGRQAPRLVRFEWNGRLLEPWPLPELDPALAEGYAGGDALVLNAGMLIRSFDVKIAGAAALEKRHFRYAPDAKQWIRLQPLKRAGTADAKTISR